MSIYLASKAQIALIITKKIIIPIKYSNLRKVFLKEVVIELFKYFNINEHFIDLELNK